MNEKAVLLSIQPKWGDLIASGEKTVEIRKTRPKIETPFKCYIYQSKDKGRLLDVLKDGDENYGEIYHGNPVFIKGIDRNVNSCLFGREQKVVGEFVCDEIVEIFECYDVHDELSGMPREYYLDWDSDDDIPIMACLPYKELGHYIGKEGVGYAWHISELKIYDKPKALSDFVRICPEWGKEALTDKCYSCEHCYRNDEACATECDCEGEIRIKKAPQSWCYVEVSRNE